MVTTGYWENLKWLILPSLSEWDNTAGFSSGAVCCFLFVLRVFGMTIGVKEIN